MALDSKLIHGLVKQARGIVQGFLCTVTYKPFASRDGYGKVTYGAGTNLKAFVSRKQRKITLTDGRDVVSELQLVLPESRVISTNDRIVMPDGSTPPILQVATTLDSAGQPYLVEVFF